MSISVGSWGFPRNVPASVSYLALRLQCALDGLRFPFDHTQKSCRRTADPARPLLPFSGSRKGSSPSMEPSESV